MSANSFLGNSITMESVFLLTTASTVYLLASLLFVIVLLVVDKLRMRSHVIICDEFPLAPGPRPWPVIGNLHLLGGHEVPYQAFGALADKYGPVFRLELGCVPSLVVNGIDNIREVLISKGAHFDGRPNFRRYNQIFSGDKENSLAFCDWSEKQKNRRDILRAHTFPRTFSLRYVQMDNLVCEQLGAMMTTIRKSGNSPVSIKPLLLQSCANIFTQYFCSRKFDTTHPQFLKMVDNFDHIFYEVNQGYAADFLPFLMPFHAKHMQRIQSWSHEIREFVVKHIIGDRFDNWSSVDEQSDFVDGLVEHVKQEKQPLMNWETALFALEDIIGGHSAIANLMVKVLGFVVSRPAVQERVQREVDAIASLAGKPQVCMSDRKALPYTESVVLEAIRLIASPIVPHVANQDSSVAGYKVQKDTIIFLNNYELNMSPTLWKEPEQFQPERFIQNGRILKAEHFLPFGGGRRSCMGYKLVQMLSVSILANILQSFHLHPVECEIYTVPIGNLAMPKDTFQFRFEPR